MPDLVVIYGPPFAGKSTVAWELARSLAGKAAVVSTDHLTSGSIAVPDPDGFAELAMAHTQLRLLVANYLKNRYHVVVEGPFLFEHAGVLHSYEAEIDQLIALMRNLAPRALVVRLDAPDDVLRARAAAAGREAELPGALRLRAAARPRYGHRFLAFDTGAMAVGEVAAQVAERLAEASA